MSEEETGKFGKRVLNNLCRVVKKHAGKIVTGIIIAGVSVVGPYLYVASQDCLRGKEIEGEISCLEQSLSDSYGIKVGVWVPSKDGFDRLVHPLKSSLKSYSPYMSLKALEGLDEAMHYYPKELLQKHIRSIEIIRTFLESTRDIEEQGAEPVANITWWGGMSISAGRNEWLRYHRTVFGSIFESKSFHHELAHMLTQAIPKEEWRALHPGADYNSSTWKSLRSVPSGFFNRYCTSDIEDDIAGTVELLYSKNYEKRVSNDLVLKKKAEYLKSWYFQISNGAIDEAYWITVQHGNVPTSFKRMEGGKGK